MKLDKILAELWENYSNVNPSVNRIHKLFESRGETVVNDHIAFRTFNDSRISVNVLSKLFTDRGYKPAGEYSFPGKKLFAKHFEHESDTLAPRVFISELLLEHFSESMRKQIVRVIDDISDDMLHSEKLILNGEIFGQASFKVYEDLRKESEYAAWLYAFGFRANHFTVSVNHLTTFKGIEDVNSLLKSEGFPLNNSGGEVKGTEVQMLKQSSTLADIVDFDFVEGRKQIPSCYYEFAERFKDNEGNLFSGFIAESADKIFESTNFRK